MKKLLLALTLCFTPMSAHALPGNTKLEVDQWIKTHPFLATYYFTVIGMGHEFSIRGFRQLQDGVFIDTSHLYYPRDELSKNTTPASEEALILTKRTFTNEVNSSGFPGEDNRPWRIDEYINIWDRSNSQALSLLEKIHSKAIADDFKSSKLIFRGDEYFDVYPGEYFRQKIDRVGENKIEPWAVVSLYIGERWGYEVTRYYGENDNEKDDFCAIIIKPLHSIKEDAVILAHNTKMFQKYMEKAKNNQLRNSPAEIKIKLPD